MLPWGIRGHPLTRSMHLYIQNAYLAKALRLFLSQKWNNVRKWNTEMFQKWNDVLKMEHRNVPEMEQRSKNGTQRCSGNGTTF